MKVRFIIGASAYAVIESQTRTMDILILPGKSVKTRLAEHATELREKAARLLRDAEFVGSAVSTIEENGIQKTKGY
jgi:hypothetical protein